MMWWRIVNFALLTIMIYMVLTLGVKIVEDINATTGVCFTSVATTICVLGYSWFDRFYRRRAAAKERLLYLRALSEKVEAEADEKKLFFHHDPYFTDTHNQYYYLNKPSAHGIIAKDGHIRDN